MNRNFGKVIGAGLLMWMLGVMIAYGQPNGKECEGKRGPKGPPLEALDLSEAQKAQLESLRTEFEATYADELAEMKELHEQVKEQRQSGDREGAKETMTEIKELRETLKSRHEEMKEKVDAILTDEQKAQLEEMKGKHGERKGRKGAGERGQRDGSGPTFR